MHDCYNLHWQKSVGTTEICTNLRVAPLKGCD